MPTVQTSPPEEPHRVRWAAESFGVDPSRYDRTRPRYPQAVVDKVMAGSPGRDVLDVGIGTGVSARPFRAVGCRVVGVEVDSRMAAFARRDGFEVEVARFEDWDPAGREFHLVIAGTTWHWIDPAAGAAKAACLLRPGGQLALFWNVGQPPAELAQAFSALYRRLLPATPFARTPTDALSAHQRTLTRAADEIRAVGTFSEPERWQVDWKRAYTTDEWLDLVPTFGGHSQFPRATLEQLIEGMRAVIEAVGGNFTMRYATVALTAWSVQPPLSRGRQKACA
jgi:SAM-dependent methyltransferase